MTDDLSIPPERLIEETRWLRDLAERLVGPDSADDLAQTVWLRALERPAAAVRQLRPWLRTVLHHAVLRRWRDDSARTRREVAAAAPEATLSTASVVERAAMCRALVQTVLALDEPGRTVVLLRFFEGLRTQQIADLQGIPNGTVRSRLQTALRTLRVKLDGEYGGRDGWTGLMLPVLFGGPPAAVVGGSVTAKVGAATVAAGVFAMTATKVGVFVGCAVLLVAGGAWAWYRPAVAVLPRGAPGVAGQGAAPMAAPTAAAAATPGVAATSYRGETRAATAESWVVTGRVVDETGAPVAGVTVALGIIPGNDDRAVPAATREAVSAPDGTFACGLNPPDDARTVVANVTGDVYEALSVSRTVQRGEAPPPPITLSVMRYTGALIGTVTDGLGKPITGATVSWLRKATTDGLGHYRLATTTRFPSARPAASAPGFASKAQQVDVARGGGSVTVDFMLAPGSFIDGVVRREDQSPVAGCKVWSSTAAGTNVVTRADGAFHLDGISTESGYCAVFAAAPGLAPARTQAMFVERHARVEITLHPGVRVVGVVVDDSGAAIAGAKVTVGSTHAPNVGVVFTAADGRFVSEAVAPGKTTISAAHGRFAPRTEALVVGAPGDAAPELRLVLSAGHHVAGRVVNLANEPIGGVSLMPRGARDLDFVDTRGSTDADGRFRLDRLGDDVVRIDASVRGYLHAMPTVTLDREDVLIQLSPAGRAAGKVIDAATRAPIPRFNVRVVWAEAGAVKPGERMATSAISSALQQAQGGSGHQVENAEGLWSIDNEELEVDAVVGIEVRAPGFSVATLPRVLTATEPDPLENVLALSRGSTVRGVVVTPQGDAIAHAAVSILSAKQRAQLAGGGAWHPERDAETTEAGAFAVDNVAAGTFHVYVNAATAPPFCAGPFQASDGRATDDLRIVVAAGATITGIVLDANNAPVADARVSVTPQPAVAGFANTRVQAGPDGRFTVAGVPPGLVTVGYTEAGGRAATLSRQITVAAGQTQEVRLAFDGPCTVRVIIEGDLPTPLCEFVVSVNPTSARGRVGVGGTCTSRTIVGRSASFDVVGLDVGEHQISVGQFAGGAKALMGNAKLTLIPGAANEVHVKVQANQQRR